MSSEVVVICKYQYGDKAWVGHIDQYNELYKYQVAPKDTPGYLQAHPYGAYIV